MSQKTHDQPVCDICGKPATSAARDVAVDSSGPSIFTKMRPAGTVKHGCDEHPATSDMIEIGSPMLDAIAYMARQDDADSPS